MVALGNVLEAWKVEMAFAQGSHLLTEKVLCLLQAFGMVEEPEVVLVCLLTSHQYYLDLCVLLAEAEEVVLIQQHPHSGQQSPNHF